MRHPPYEKRLQGLDLHYLQRRRPRTDLITALFKVLLNVDPNLFFLPPGRRVLGGQPYKVPQVATPPRQWGGSAFSVKVGKYWNNLPASVVTVPSVNVFKKTLEQVWTEVFTHLLHWLNTYFPSPSSHLHTTINSYQIYPKSPICKCAFSGLLWLPFCHYKS